MKNALRSIFIATFAVLGMAGASLPSNAAPRASAFDGQWSVVIYTLQGDCNRALRYSLRIVNGRVQPEEQNYRAAGAVAPNGSVRVVVAEGGRSANGSGRLVGNSGRGWWRTDTGECSGQWTAARRMAEY
jgi:hypothetical protein